jgi:hypothetical protein
VIPGASFFGGVGRHGRGEGNSHGKKTLLVKLHEGGSCDQSDSRDDVSPPQRSIEQFDRVAFANDSFDEDRSVNTGAAFMPLSDSL